VGKSQIIPNDGRLKQKTLHSSGMTVLKQKCEKRTQEFIFFAAAVVEKLTHEYGFYVNETDACCVLKSIAKYAVELFLRWMWCRCILAT
jgi:hypothetical protein